MTEAMYGIIMEVLNRMEWDHLCLVGGATYGASSMIRCNMRLTTCLQNDQPLIICECSLCCS